MLTKSYQIESQLWRCQKKATLTMGVFLRSHHREGSSHLILVGSPLLTYWHIAEAMGLPSGGSADEVRQLIEGKLQDEHEVRNVQVVFEEASFLNVRISLTG